MLVNSFIVNILHCAHFTLFLQEYENNYWINSYERSYILCYFPHRKYSSYTSQQDAKALCFLVKKKTADLVAENPNLFKFAFL